MTRRLILAAVAVTSTVIAAVEYLRRGRRRLPALPWDDTEFVIFQGAEAITLAGHDGQPRRIEPGELLAMDAEVAYDLIEFDTGGHWRLADTDTDFR